jgi:glycosyltransferase involved in cell wall biosynthesis
MKILKIIHGYPPQYNAGSEVYSQSICDELCKENEVFVFTREENPYQPDFSIRKENAKNNLTLFYVNMAQGKDGFKHKVIDEKLSEIVAEIRPDVAHVGHLNHLSTGIVKVLKEMKIPIVFTLHDFWLMCPRGQFLQRNFGNQDHLQLCNGQEDRKCATSCYNAYFTGKDEFNENDVNYWTAWIHQRMLETKKMADLIDVFIAPSLYLKNRFVNEFNIPEKKIIYLDYGFPTLYLTPSIKSKKSKELVFGYIGTHIPSKGINLIIEAFSKLKTESKLYIWGSKDEQSTKALQNMAEKSEAKIFFKGTYVNKNLADEVFSQIDCIIVPSIWGENSPLVIHEAQACKIPVITANYGGMAEYVNHQVNGLLFEHRNSDSLVEQIQWAIQHHDQMKQFGKKGYINHPKGEVPNITDHCNQLISIYNSIRSREYTK